MPFLKTGQLNMVLAAIGLGLTMSLTGCGTEGNPDEAKAQVQSIQAAGTSLDFDITEEDKRTEISKEYVEINLDGLSKDLVIENGGDYLIKGSTPYRIIIDAKEHPVHLFLDGVSIETEESAGILALSASKLILTCIEGTDNVISDSSYYKSYPEYDACVYSVPDLTINGTGKLNVRSIYEDAIHTKDIMKIIGVNLSAQAKGDGLKGNDGIYLSDGVTRVEAEKNGLITNKNGKEIKGSVVIRNLELTAIAGEYAIDSYDDLVITGSRAYLNGIRGSYFVASDCYIEEGNLVNE